MFNKIEQGKVIENGEIGEIRNGVNMLTILEIRRDTFFKHKMDFFALLIIFFCMISIGLAQNNSSENRLYGFIDPTVKVGDFLTTLTIFITVGSLAWTLRNDAKSRKAEQANKMKSLAVNIIGKWVQWTEISFLIFELSDAIFVDTSELLKKEFKHPERARGFMWKELRIQRSRLLDKALKYDLTEGYGDGVRNNPYIGQFYDLIIKRLKEEEEAMFKIGLLQNSAHRLNVHFRRGEENYDVAKLRNDLADDANEVKDLYAKQIESIVKNPKLRLDELINGDDKSVLDDSNLRKCLSIKLPEIKESIYDLRFSWGSEIDWPENALNPETQDSD